MELTPNMVSDKEPPDRAAAKNPAHHIAPQAASSHEAQVRAFRKQFFPLATQAQWNDYRWQLANRVTRPQQLAAILDLSADERAALAWGHGGLPFAITPHYLSLLDPQDAAQPLRRCMVPSTHEHLAAPGEFEDPLCEEHDMVVPGLVHRYPDRVLFLATRYCSAYCRYCTRSRMVGGQAEPFSRAQWKVALDYIRATPAVRDVIVSGGDPLTLADAQLDWLLTALRSIEHVEIIRIGTKAPMVLPQRISPALVRMLKRHHPLYLSVHCTHPDELTPPTVQAFNRLADAGIPMGSQTVLLKGVNDDPETLKALYHGLLKVRVRPYYLYQCDPILGSSHFRTTVQSGLECIKALRGNTSGYAVPTFVIDAPGGGGKIPVYPQTMLGHENNSLLLTNYEGRTFAYPDPNPEDAGNDSPVNGAPTIVGRAH